MQRSAVVIICRLSVCLLLSSVTQVYCDKTAAVKIMQFLLKCSPMPTLCLPSLITKLEGGPLDRGAQTGGGWFLIEFAILVRDRV